MAGKRLKCPKCGGAIKVPGTVSAAGDDDDWLALDQPLPSTGSNADSGPVAATSKESNKSNGATARPAKHAGTPRREQDSATSNASSDQPNWLDDLPALAPEEPRPSGDLFGANLPPLSDIDMAALNTAGGFHDFDEPLPEGDPVVLSEADVVDGGEPVTEYRAKCPICESIHYVTPKEAGKEISCGDCYSRFVVPPPPKQVPKKKIDIKAAPTFQLAGVDADRPSYAGPEAKSAAEYLRQAEDEDFEDEQKDEYETPDIGAWLKSMFGIFLDPSVLVYWIALSALGAFPAMIAVVIPSPIISVGILAAAFVYLMLVVCCGFAIMESVAGGEKTVSEWPVFNPADWIGQCFVAISALALSSLPGAVMGLLVFGPGLALLATSLFSIFVIFPFVILSMLDNGSVFMPVSGEVTKSITRCTETWGGVYFSSMLLFGAYFLAVALFSTMPPVVGVFFDCFLSVGLIFVYFSMLGGLAFQIGQAINGREEE